jgi:uncharacterized repeat protein (TIGR02543 family)
MKKTVFLAVVFLFVLLIIGCGGAPPDATFKVIYRCSIQESTGFPPTDDKRYVNGTKATVLGKGSLQLAGHTFDGWNTRADGSGSSYKEGDEILVDRGISLYAMWKPE